MARTYQIITLFARDTIVRNVTLALLGLSKERWNPADACIDRNTDLIDRAHDALQRVGLRHIADRPLSQTSYGERRRVEIAMALAQNPKVLLLDEPLRRAFRSTSAATCRRRCAPSRATSPS